jgi:hypothetical protein
MHCKFMQRKTMAVGVLSVLSLAATAKSDVAYHYVTDQNAYSVAPGGSVSVPVYLFESLTPGSASVVAGDQGLEGAGAMISRTGAVPSDPAKPTDFTYNTADFGGLTAFTVNPAGSSASFVEAVDNSAPAGPSGVAVAGGNLEFLGAFTISAGSQLLPDQVTQFSLGKRVGVGNTITYGNFYDLDQTSVSPAYTGVGATQTTFTVTVSSDSAPEPSSLGLFAAASLLTLRTRRPPRAARQNA